MIIFCETRKRPFNIFFKILAIIPILSLLSCTSLPKPNIKNLATKAALKAAQPMLEKVFLTEAPILPPSKSQYPIFNQLPGTQFNPEFKQDSISFDLNGNLLLTPGDYSIPVMTYCMKESGESPAGHTYVLATMRGSRAKVIQELNTKASKKFTPDEIQFLSWSLQAGLSYSELTLKNQTILDFVNPEFKDEIKESFLKKFQKEWDAFASKSAGLIPEFDNASDELLDELGDVGQSIKNIRAFRDEIRNGANFDDLKNRINTQTHSQSSSSNTPWSKISDEIYARLITQKGFLGVGRIQVRVLPRSTKRSPNSNLNNSRLLDLHSLISDSRVLNIQPLSVSLIIWPRGLIGVAVMAEPPMILVALFATILASQTIEWDSFLKLKDLIGSPKDSKVKKIIEKGNLILNEELDKLEKPLRDLNIIDRKTKDTSSSKGQKSETREYTKEGGEDALQKEFNKIPKETIKTSDGVEIKKLDDGTTIVKRPKTIGSDGRPKDASLEVQPPEDAHGKMPKLRVKVRYVK